MSEFLLEIEHLRKAFDALVATDDVTLAIRKGEPMHSSVRTAPARPPWSGS